MKKVVKIIGAIILTPVILILLLFALFYFPPFQNWAVKQVASYASEKTGMEISVDHVNLAFPLDLAVEGVKVIQQNDSLPQQKDTVADIQRTIVDIQLMPLLRSQVEVDELNMQTMKFNTTNFIASARVKGEAKELSLKSHGIDLSKENVLLNEAFLDGAKVDVALSDTVPEDTTESKNYWKITLQQLRVKNSDVTVHMPGDTLTIGAHLGDAEVKNGYFDLYEALYQVGSVDLKNSSVTYDNNFTPKVKGLDYNHLSLTGVNIGLDSLSYHAPDLYMKIRNAALKEKCGLQLVQMTGTVKMDSTTVYIPQMTAATTNSKVQLSMEMDLNAFETVSPGQLKLRGDAELGKQDLLLFMDDMPKTIRNGWPHYPLSISTDVYGNLWRMNINKLEAELPTVFEAKANGYVANLTTMDNLVADINLNATTHDLGFITYTYMDKDLRKTVKVPHGINVKGNVKANGALYRVDLKASQGGGTLALKGQCDTKRMAYKADIKAKSFPLQHFLPKMGLTAFTGKAKVNGVGTDVFSKKMRLDADAQIDRFAYNGFDLSGTTATAKIHNGLVDATANCANKLLNGTVTLGALMNLKNIKATVACSLDKADFYGLKLTDTPLSTSLCAHVDVASDLNDYYKVEGFVSDVVIEDTADVMRAEELSMDILTRKDSTWAKVNSGDFNLDFVASGGYKALMKVATNLTNELTRQIERKYISQDSLKQVLPIAHLQLHSGKKNFIAQYAEKLDYKFREINADITSSPTDGLNGYAQVDSLYAMDMQLDKIRLDVETDETGFKYKGQIKNEKDNPQYCFNALFDGSLFETGSDINVSLYDQDDNLGIKLGLRAMLEQNGIRFKLADTNAVLGYRNFTANEDNYLFLGDNNRVSAYMQLKADDGTGLQLYSDDDNEEALQDLTLGLNHLDLASIVSIIPYCPQVEGVMNGDFHMIQTEKELSVSSSVGVDKLKYEGCSMGDLSTEFVYIPQEDGSHYVDGILMHNGNDVGTIKGTYKAGETTDSLDAKVDLAKLPLDLVNGFIPDQIIGLKGYGDGEIDVHGPLSSLEIDGEVDLDSAYLISIPYGVELSFDNRPVKIKDSRLLFENFNMYAHNKQPLVINGYVDFSNTNNMNLNMRMKAQNFLVIDSKEKRKSEVFGKTYVNFNAFLTGPLTAMRMKGNLDVLGTTDMTYVMRDTPLSTDNRLDELVKFTDLKSETEEKVAKPAIEGLYMDLSISIDEGARVFAALNAAKSNYLDLIGGGNLRMIYSNDQLRLTGRYTIDSGEMKYALPVIPLQTFTIQDGSYVEFTGEVMNPTLNITATERLKSAVSSGGTNRNVAFDTGVKISQTLNDMGLEFIIDAPEDMTIHGELQTMSTEERGKIAVTMLTTGMYLSDGNTSNFSMNSALSSFLQSEINSITGNALRTLDLSIGLDNSTDATGALHTDYSFKFAKRFWNNRVRLVVGGKVSSDDANAQNLFDNLAIEYRLDQSANTNLKLFYDRAVYDYLEGYVGEYGVGLVWKRKLQNLKDLIKLSTYMNVKTDTTKVEKGEHK